MLTDFLQSPQKRYAFSKEQSMAVIELQAMGVAWDLCTPWAQILLLHTHGWRSGSVQVADTAYTAQLLLDEKTHGKESSELTAFTRCHNFRIHC